MADSAAVYPIPIHVQPYTIYILTTNQKNLTGAVTPFLYFNGLFTIIRIGEKAGLMFFVNILYNA